MATKFFGNVKTASTSVNKPVLLLKTADGTADTGKVAAGLTAYYFRQGGSATVAVTLSDLSSLNSAFSSGGVKEIADGLYRVDFPDAAFATGADWVLLVVKDGTTAIYMELVALEAHGADDLAGVLPTVAPGAANGLPTLGTGSGQLNPDGTGAMPISFGTTLPASPTSGTTGSALSYADSKVGRRGTAQGGATSTITLDAGASAADNAYKDHFLKITAGTGAGQFATITGYVGGTKVATIWRPSAGATWTTTPDNTSVFQIEPYPAMDMQQGQAFNNTGQTSNLPVNTAAIATAVMSDTTDADGATIAGLASPIAAIKAKTDNLPADPASNTQVNTRMATFTYTAPDNSDISTILTDVLAVQTSVGTGLHSLVAALPADFPAVDGSGRVTLAPSQPGVTIPTVTTLTNAPASAESLTGSVVSATTTTVTISATGATTFNATANAYAGTVPPRYLSFTSGANRGLVVTVTSSSVAGGNLLLGFAATTGVVATTAGDTVQVD